MAEQKQAVAEIIRPELAERGLSDPLEFLYQHMAEFSDAERISLLSYSLDAEGQAFEVQCRLCAEYAKGRRLREFIERYNKQAAKAGSKVISYQYARQMSRIGVQMVASEKRMTQDYPALSPSYFVTALGAPEFTVALDRAQERVAAHQEDPEQTPKYTVRAFKTEVNPRERDSSDPVMPPEEHQPVPTGANCYDCEHCWQPNGHQRLAVVNTLGTAAIDLLLEPCSAWVCRKTKQVISVRTQIVFRAEAMAKSCNSFSPSSASLPTEPEDGPKTASIDAAPEGVTEESDNAAFSELAKELVGAPLSLEALDEHLAEDS